jgi:hypothetical protein
MLDGFEDITYDLTDREKELLPGIVAGLKKRTGRYRAITSAEIIKAIPELSGPRVRKIINYIRNGYLVPGLIATSDGYYVSVDKNEVEKYAKSLDGREAAIRSIKLKVLEYLKQLNHA